MVSRHPVINRSSFMVELHAKVTRLLSKANKNRLFLLLKSKDLLVFVHKLNKNEFSWPKSLLCTQGNRQLARRTSWFVRRVSGQ